MAGIDPMQRHSRKVDSVMPRMLNAGVLASLAATFALAPQPSRTPGIGSADVSVDGGGSWQQVRLQRPVLPKCPTRFRMMWTWQGGPATLRSRCVDETGFMHPTLSELVKVRGLNSFCHLSALQSWGVAQNGEISNAHA
ncbi:MAG: hypothetical protein ACJ8G3_12890 [Burkholderiaceae bacterium]